MKNIVLTGFMGTGKSEVGMLLARKLGYAFVDCDLEIRRRTGMTIPDIFRINGEAHFRDVEAAVIGEISAGSDLVIATGGGAVLREENMINLRRNGVIVCLTADPETIAQRTDGNRQRPLLDVADRLSEIRRLLSERAPFYQRADISVRTDGRGPLAIAEEIIDKTGLLLRGA